MRSIVVAMTYFSRRSCGCSISGQIAQRIVPTETRMLPIESKTTAPNTKAGPSLSAGGKLTFWGRGGSSSRHRVMIPFQNVKYGQIIKQYKSAWMHYTPSEMVGTRRIAYRGIRGQRSGRYAPATSSGTT